MFEQNRDLHSKHLHKLTRGILCECHINLRLVTRSLPRKIINNEIIIIIIIITLIMNKKALMLAIKRKRCPRSYDSRVIQTLL